MLMEYVKKNKHVLDCISNYHEMDIVEGEEIRL